MFNRMFKIFTNIRRLQTTQKEKTLDKSRELENHMNVIITNTAAEQIESLVKARGEGCVGVRLMIRGGGCSGMQYDFAFVITPDENDLQFYQGNALLVVDSMSIMYLDGSTLDYTESLAGSQFIIKNPTAKQTCGCGSSFST